MIIDHPNTYGAQDRLTCGHCGGDAMLARRSPHPDLGDKYEIQIFRCLACGDEKHRTVDAAGQTYEWVSCQ
jgi:hypothetical protein